MSPEAPSPDLDRVPGSIGDSKTKRAELKQAGITHAYLGQGLVFEPSLSAVPGFEEYLRSRDEDPGEFRLHPLMPTGDTSNIYNSPRLDRVWQDIVKGQYNGAGQRKPAGFEQFVRAQSRDTMEKLFGLPETEIESMQVDNLQQGLLGMQMLVAELHGRPATGVILPEQFRYPGYDKDFVTWENKRTNGPGLKIVSIPEVQMDGTQDLKALRQVLEQAREDGELLMLIDQEHNNNSSGFDRSIDYNEELSSILKEFSDVVFYVGDTAYKGMKLDILDPYPLQQQLLNDGVTAGHYFSPTKIGNYRGTPTHMSILTLTPGELANTERIRGAMAAIKRAMGIGATEDGAITMNALAHDAEFQGEVRTLNLYLAFVRDRLHGALQGSGIEDYFGPQTNGIFRCLPPEIIAALNSGDRQAVTVGPRINMWPLGDEELNRIFLDIVNGT